jgi:transcriptional regulator with XRE-family HTH domain
MSDFGQRLRAARERRGVSLRELSDRTKFPVAAFEALERNDPSRFPGGIFARAFVRSYAAAVGLDSDATVREFIERFGIEPAPSTVLLDRMADRCAPPAIVPTLLKLVAISLAAAAILFYITRLRQPDGADTPGADARRSSRRAVSDVSKGAPLP